MKFIYEICCGYHKSESHNQNDEISNPLNCLKKSVKNMFKKYQTHLGKFANKFTWMLFIAHCS